jgi:antirestriction protein ArdC
MIQASAFFSSLDPQVSEESDNPELTPDSTAYYDPTVDKIFIRPKDTFPTEADYYAALAHEFVHSTQHPSRLNRQLGQMYYGDLGYAREEIIAELGAKKLCKLLGIKGYERSHDHYIKSWLRSPNMNLAKLLLNETDKETLDTAEEFADEAVEYLLQHAGVKVEEMVA